MDWNKYTKVKVIERSYKIFLKEFSSDDNPLINSPHTAEELIDENWNHSYSKKLAFYPDNRIDEKYWPPVKRIDNVYGDRNLFCECPPIETYDDSTKVA